MVLPLGCSVSAQATGTSGILQNKEVPADVLVIIKNADKEIDQRIENLNDLITRIGLMKKISAEEQKTLILSIQNEINQLASLKTKIDSDVDLQTAKADYQSITKSYRIYALIFPQISIMAASDRVMTIVNSMNIIGSKIQLRISALDGNSAAAMNQILSDFTAKISDASTQANMAINEVSLLEPDQGDKTKMKANATALKDAKEKIKSAISSLIEARKDLGTIVRNLKEINGLKN